MKLRMILRKYLINNLGYKILALVFSFLLWLVILNTTDPEYTRTINNIPVQILNEDMVLDGTHVYTISSGEITSLSVTGKRSIISTLSSGDFLVTADFEELSITNAVPIKVEMVGDKQRYASQISITPRDTSMIINLEEMTTGVVPVELEYRGELSEDIVVDEANISPKKITIEAPESVIEAAVRAVVTVEAAIISSDTTITREPVLRDESGGLIRQTGDVSLDPAEIEVEFKVSHKKDVPIMVNAIGEPAEGYVFAGVELSQDTITIKGTEEDIAALTQVNIPGEIINMNGVSESFEVEIDVTPYLPDTVVVYGESPFLTAQVRIISEEEARDINTTEQEEESK